MAQASTDATDPGPFRHGSLVRCPACGHLWAPEPGAADDPAGETLALYCPACGCEFTAELLTHFSYVSPARAGTEGEDEEE